MTLELLLDVFNSLVDTKVSSNLGQFDSSQPLKMGLFLQENLSALSRGPWEIVHHLTITLILVAGFEVFYLGWR